MIFTLAGAFLAGATVALSVRECITLSQKKNPTCDEGISTEWLLWLKEQRNKNPPKKFLRNIIKR